MRKGADVLSKWVGEAERQLRLLFEEAKNSQPSIIFFDEIDGLAPVRSSKQDQIHASIVSTLLALMDGMDGRGQVIIIGATNRPDAVDPALRRPGRFDREFYFPLPDLGARRRILEINTSKWQPPLKEEFLDELAVLTKGYGGADLRVRVQSLDLQRMAIHALSRLARVFPDDCGFSLSTLGSVHRSRTERSAAQVSTDLQVKRPSSHQAGRDRCRSTGLHHISPESHPLYSSFVVISRLAASTTSQTSLAAQSRCSSRVPEESASRG